jgi:5-methylcytosine-specific restriction enzyme A
MSALQRSTTCQQKSSDNPSMWHKTSSHSRGYGAAWRKLRQAILLRDGYICRCPECARTGAVRLATEVDHIVAKADGGTDDPSNLRSVNGECHKAITQHARGATVRKQVGVDGWPVGGGVSCKT